MQVKPNLSVVTTNVNELNSPDTVRSDQEYFSPQMLLTSNTHIEIPKAKEWFMYNDIHKKWKTQILNDYILFKKS